MRFLCSSVQRLAAIDSPARFTTAVAPSISRAHGPTSPLGIQGTVRSPAAEGGLAKRLRTTTSWPSAEKDAASGCPRNPEAPAMTTFTAPVYPCALRPGFDISLAVMLTKQLVYVLGF